ncbi:hypothetical protein [Streptomyces albidoflavus]|uniref:hypothetical protein n=1 Tax=Streptomyces albidoflavus TaxID=1886 RepID=UPI001020A092|nr:hypothetical protein [Streptomyces albidoflavus]RZF02806.1 hypothetical protein C0R05_31830 [Streptomyces albidoflavus]
MPRWSERDHYTATATLPDGTTTTYSRFARPKHVMVTAPDGTREEVFVGTTMVASAALVSKEHVRSVVSHSSGEWQSEVWDLYNSVPELRYGVTWAANACSRARLYVGRVDPDGSTDPAPLGIVTGPNAENEENQVSPSELAKTRMLLAPLNELTGGRVRAAGMLKRLATHLNVPGESYLVGFDHPDHGRRTWLVCSRDELKAQGSTLRIVSPEIPGKDIAVRMDRATVVRMWRAHPRLHHDADSPVQALRGALKELLDFSSHIAATAESRLAGAGLLFVPQELAVPKPEQTEDGPNPLHSDPFTSSLIEAMAAPLRSRDSASAIVPLVVRGPAAAGKELRHLSFATPFDENVQDMRKGAIQRIATGLDLPPEVLLGTADTNHWGAWAIDEAGLKLHIEPLLGLICDSLTSHFYQPALRAMGVEDWSSYVVWYETSDLALRPNRVPEASEAHSRGAISDAAYRRVLGFGDEDAPTDQEKNRALAKQVALTNANLAPYLLPELGVTLPEEAKEAALPQGVPAPLGAPKNTTRQPSLTGPVPGAGPQAGRNEQPSPGRSFPQSASATLAASADDAARAWRTTCLDMAVRRALARAGQFLIRATPRSERVKLQRMPRDEVHLHLAVKPEQMDSALAGAYNEFHEVTPHEPCLHAAVDAYVRALLTAGEKHQVHYLDQALAQFGCE